jgi:sugar/nucleoside kinase (ribokinase family)
MKKRSIAIIGSINRDIITTEEGDTKESLGGILYNTLSLSGIGQNLFEIFPVSYVGSRTKKDLLEILKDYPNVSLKGIIEIEGEINTNRLVYVSKNERRETTNFTVGEITFSMIEPFLTTDVLLFNFISGYDVSIDTVEEVRKKTGSLIFADVHSLVLKKEKGIRTFQTIENWEEWAQNIDILQMNTKELLFFTNRPRMALTRRTIRDSIQSILTTGVKIVLVTAGEEGAYLGYRDRVFFLEQQYSPVVKDTTGCGDIFSSSFISKFLETGDPLLSGEWATLVSGKATQYIGLDKCRSVKRFKGDLQ